MQIVKALFLYFGLIGVFGVCIPCFGQHQKEKIQTNAGYVDPFICTSNDHGQTDPSASIPFGMVKPCADMIPLGHAGYNYASDTILGFSNTRISGVGCQGAGGNIRVFPSFKGDKTLKTLKVPYLKKSEVGKAGYYKVQLGNNIKAELSATGQIAYHRYTFPDGVKPVIVLDLHSSFNGTAKEWHKLHEDGIISGWISDTNVCGKGKYKFYFAIETKPGHVEDISEVDSKLFLTYQPSENNEVLLKCALSVVNEQKALKKLKRSKNITFDKIVDNAFKRWDRRLNCIVVETENVTLKNLFYSHLFHALQTPYAISEADGSFKGSDGEKYVSQGNTYYHGWSIWDTFRTKLPLFSLLYPDQYSEIMWSIGQLYKQGKPQWTSENEPFLTVRTEHSEVSLLDAYRKGLLTFSLFNIFPQLEEESNRLPFLSPDNVLESSYDLWALAQISKELGLNNKYERYIEKAGYYKETWRAFFMHLGEKADIMHGKGLYEGTLWQYRWFVPFDIEGLQALVGGRRSFEDQLDYFFSKELFNMGNQPDIQVPYLYNYTPSPWKTQMLVNKILTQETNNWYGTHHKLKKPVVKKVFTATPDGYIPEMDDDAGTMSSWFIWSSIGLYPVCPGEPKLALTTPLFTRTNIKTKKENLEIVAHGLSPKAIFIQKITFNEKKLNNPFINFNEIKEGGKLEFFMGELPASF